MKSMRLFLFCLLATLGINAHAQRTLVPVVDFKDIPVAQATGHALTAEQVRQAFIEAGDDLRWNVADVGGNQLEATFVKQNKHTIVVTILYNERSYSVLYKSSVNMKYRDHQTSFDLANGEEAALKQKALFASRPEGPYASARAKGVIHPFYERWVYDLLDLVRHKLKRAQ
ncbi:MAG: hypothetical protein ABS55_03790 [Lautropia sp. SCN 70-15]|nr:MAG: hypothetical protein ABS55_03790 [Lautropia sp. SCN 70-15]